MFTVHTNRGAALQDYLVRHARQLQTFARCNGYPVEDEESLLIVAGISRVQDFSAITYASEVSTAFKLQISLQEVTERLPSCTMAVEPLAESKLTTPIHISRGPDIPEVVVENPQVSSLRGNCKCYQQSVFIWAYAVKWRFPLKAAAAPRDLDSERFNDTHSDMANHFLAADDEGTNLTISKYPQVCET